MSQNRIYLSTSHIEILIGVIVIRDIWLIIIGIRDTSGKKHFELRILIVWIHGYRTKIVGIQATGINGIWDL